MATDYTSDEKQDRWLEATTPQTVDEEVVEVVDRAARELAIREVGRLIDMGATPNQAIDIWATELCDIGLATWADIRGASPGNIGQSVQKGRRNIANGAIQEVDQ